MVRMSDNTNHLLSESEVEISSGSSPDVPRHSVSGNHVRLKIIALSDDYGID